MKEHSLKIESIYLLYTIILFISETFYKINRFFTIICILHAKIYTRHCEDRLKDTKRYVLKEVKIFWEARSIYIK